MKGKSDSFKVCPNAFRSKSKNSEVCILEESMSFRKAPASLGLVEYGKELPAAFPVHFSVTECLSFLIKGF